MNQRKIAPIIFVLIAFSFFHFPKLSAASKPLELKSVNWDIATYYNPRVNINGQDAIPFHDNLTATEWCKHVPNKKYVEGRSQINRANPQDGLRYRWDGSQWIEINGGDYPRVYICMDRPGAIDT